MQPLYYFLDFFLLLKYIEVWFDHGSFASVIAFGYAGTCKYDSFSFFLIQFIFNQSPFLSSLHIISYHSEYVCNGQSII